MQISYAVPFTGCVKFITKTAIFCTGFQPGVQGSGVFLALAINFQHING
jgi:hypothetical protein